MSDISAGSHSSLASPSLAEFKRQAKRYQRIPVVLKSLADLETPVSLYLKVSNQPHSFLLESVEQGSNLGRYSMIGANPVRVFEGRGTRMIVRENATLSSTKIIHLDEDPLKYLERITLGLVQAPTRELPSFTGGLVGYFGYDAIRYFERIPDNNPDALELPDFYFCQVNDFYLFDHIHRTLNCVVNVEVDRSKSIEKQYSQAITRLKKMHNLANNMQARPIIKKNVKLGAHSNFRANFTRSEFCKMVLKAKKRIRIGDIFQVVLSQRFTKKIYSSSFEVYRQLRSLNPSPYMFYMNCGGFKLVGASPEMHVRCENGLAEVRPIAGTRPRGQTDAQDQGFERELLADAKEKAEHLMLVDLGRNDLGRVCKYKSVHVPKFMTIERYSHVMHIVSHVQGLLAVKNTVFDLVRATFPAGTISGAPKIKAMTIIDELEKTRRGFYSGIVCFFSYNGSMDSCIAIRSAVIKNHYAHVQAGAGIVWDSIPRKEFNETISKASAVLKAIDMANGQG